jgi:hypothetical protein
MELGEYDLKKKKRKTFSNTDLKTEVNKKNKELLNKEILMEKYVYNVQRRNHKNIKEIKNVKRHE